MNIRACIIAFNFIGFSGLVQGQNVQNNNRGIIVNQVFVPAYPQKTSADYLQDYENGKAASAQRGEAAANAYLETSYNRTMSRAYRNELGTVITDLVTYRVVGQASKIYSSLQFDASDVLTWDLPVGTKFFLLTTPGPGGHAAISVIDFRMTIPASFNGFSHTPEIKSMGYVDLTTLNYEKVSFSSK